MSFSLDSLPLSGRLIKIQQERLSMPKSAKKLTKGKKSEDLIEEISPDEDMMDDLEKLEENLAAEAKLKKGKKLPNRQD